MTIEAVLLAKLLGSTVDISPLLRFHFWECVYYHQSETSFPSDSKEGLGNIIGISEHCGHALTYKVLQPILDNFITALSYDPLPLATPICVPAC
jgi:hypothetical protein